MIGRIRAGLLAVDRLPRARWWLVGAWTAAILVGSSIPGAYVQLPGSSDKLGHFLEYFVLGVLVCRALRQAAGRTALGFAVLAVATFAALDELHQALIPGRVPDLLDWAADAWGAALGLLAMRAWWQRRDRVPADS